MKQVQEIVFTFIGEKGLVSARRLATMADELTNHRRIDFGFDLVEDGEIKMQELKDAIMDLARRQAVHPPNEPGPDLYSSYVSDLACQMIPQDGSLEAEQEVTLAVGRAVTELIREGKMEIVAYSKGQNWLLRLASD